jgi:hypothetical protein
MDVWSINKEMLTYKPIGRIEVEWSRRKQGYFRDGYCRSGGQSVSLNE